MESGTQTHTHGLTTSLFLTPLVLLDEGIGFCVWACFLWMGLLVNHRANVFLPQLGRPALAWPELARVCHRYPWALVILEHRGRGRTFVKKSPANTSHRTPLRSDLRSKSVCQSLAHS